MSKLRQQIMWALSIKVEDTLRQIIPVYDLYKDSLDDILDSNIDDIVANKIDTNSCSLKQITSATQSKTLLNVQLPLGLFSEVVSNRNNNSSPSAKRSSSLTLPPSIVPREL